SSPRRRGAAAGRRAGGPRPDDGSKPADGPRTDDGGRQFTVQLLLEVAARLRADGEPLSTATVAEAAEQALRLAAFRGRARPGLTDVTDAMLSCFVSDDSGLSGPLGAAIAAVFGGAVLGDLPDGLASPPLVAEARAQAKRLRFVVDDGAIRQVSLDTARKPAQVRRREFLATMRFVGVGFARQIAGADLVAGTGLGQLFERWEYAWTPLVEMALVEASAEGGSLAEVRAVRIRKRLQAADPSAAAAAQLVAELVLMGAESELPAALSALRRCYDADPRLASVVASLHTLTGLVSETGRLALGGPAPAVHGLLNHGLAAVAYLLGPLADLPADQAAEACQALLGLRALLRRLAEPDLAGQLDCEAPRRELRRLRQQRAAGAQLHGCLVGISYSDGELEASALQAEVVAHLHPGADPDRVSAFLLGLMQAAPDLIVHDPDLLAAVNARLAELDEVSLLRVLPDLRQAFTWLRPTETARLAELAAAAAGLRAEDLDVVLDISPADLARARTVELDLLASLSRDGLGGAR
ncbi:MAG: DUF5682 family protein, partial [Propionibacteriaceae bacterium]|nr:DUF5682 family protein [Propionibacteriaceae bacterium]